MFWNTDKNEVWNDPEIELTELEYRYALPRWAHTSTEWAEYVTKRCILLSRVRSMNDV